MTATVTPLICSECGTGNYREGEAYYAPGLTEYACTNCDHAISERDLSLDSGESLTTANGVLCVVTPTDLDDFDF